MGGDLVGNTGAAPYLLGIAAFGVFFAQGFDEIVIVDAFFILFNGVDQLPFFVIFENGDTGVALAVEFGDFDGLDGAFYDGGGDSCAVTAFRIRCFAALAGTSGQADHQAEGQQGSDIIHFFFT